jgi:Flp pilus assembly protein TadG
MLSAISRRLSAARALWRHLRLNESGSVATVLVAVPVIAGTVAIGVETGQLYRTKRQMQNAADAAALAGSVEKINGRTGTITSAALYESQRNGFTNGSNGVTVTVNTSPTGFGTTPGSVQVQVTKSAKFSLGGVLLNWMGRSNTSFDIKASAVAGQSTTTSTPTVEGCILALTPQEEQGISITNFNNFGSDCSIMSNGSAMGDGSSASITMSGFNNGTIHNSTNNARVWTRGTFSQTSKTGSKNAFVADQILEKQGDWIYDPYASLATPTPGLCQTFTEGSGNSVTLTPGTYCGGVLIQNKNTVYFTPGDYYIVDGNLTIRSDNNVSCPTCTANNGVTFILTASTDTSLIGGVSITSENNVTLNAGKNNTYPGLLFWQDIRAPAGTMADASSKTFTVSSLNNVTLSGAVYFPQNRIDISQVNNIGGSPTTGCTIWIGRYIKFSSYNNNYKGGCSTYGTTPAGITTTNTRNKVMQ